MLASELLSNRVLHIQVVCVGRPVESTVWSQNNMQWTSGQHQLGDNRNACSMAGLRVIYLSSFPVAFFLRPPPPGQWPHSAAQWWCQMSMTRASQ